MPYADTDFFIALLTPEDRLGKSAVAIYNKFKGNIYTSLATVIELVLVARKKGIPLWELLTSTMEIANVEGMENTEVLAALRLMINEGFGTFDAFYAVLCRGAIISSDHIFDKEKINVIKIE